MNLLAPAGVRAAASYVTGRYSMSERRACRLVGLARSTHRYRSWQAEGDAALRARLKESAAQPAAERANERWSMDFVSDPSAAEE